MTTIEDRRAAHGVTEAFRQDAIRHRKREEKAATFFESLGGVRMCVQFARNVFVGVAADERLRTSFGDAAGEWERCLAQVLVGYWSGEAFAGAEASFPGAVPLEAWTPLVASAAESLDVPVPLRTNLAAHFRRVAARFVQAG